MRAVHMYLTAQRKNWLESEAVMVFAVKAPHNMTNYMDLRISLLELIYHVMRFPSQAPEVGTSASPTHYYLCLYPRYY
jgi:hypothetical protein